MLLKGCNHKLSGTRATIVPYHSFDSSCQHRTKSNTFYLIQSPHKNQDYFSKAVEVSLQKKKKKKKVREASPIGYTGCKSLQKLTSVVNEQNENIFKLLKNKEELLR